MVEFVVVDGSENVARLLALLALGLSLALVVLVAA